MLVKVPKERKFTPAKKRTIWKIARREKEPRMAENIQKVRFACPFVRPNDRAPQVKRTRMNAAVSAEKFFPENELAMLGLKRDDRTTTRAVTTPVQTRGWSDTLKDFAFITERMKNIADTRMPMPMTNVFTASSD